MSAAEAPARGCGSCTLCCKLFPVPDLDKPAGRWCAHVAQGAGCGIHATRPQVCRAFFCQWIYNEDLGPEWKPETARFVLSIYPGSNALAVTVDPAQPAAWKRAPYHDEIRRWARAALEQKTQVVVFVGTRATVVLPEEDVELGPLGPGDAISVGRVGARWEARVKRAGPA